MARDENDLPATVGKMPHPTGTQPPTMPPYSPEELAHLQDLFGHIGGGGKHNGAAVIDLDDYVSLPMLQK